jgi:importin subunit alpha-1
VRIHSIFSLHNINNPSDEKFLEKIVWSLSNLCRGKQTSEMNNIIPVFPVLVKLLSSTHCETLLNACWAFTYLTEENDTVVKALKEENLIPQFVSLLTHENTKITHVALRILGNFMLSGYVQEVIDCGIMNYINALFTSNDKHVKCEICYLLSLIAENGEDNISLLINSSSELRTLINMMQYGMLSEKMEATWVMFNLANKGTDLQLRALADMAAIPALCQNLDVQDIKFILLVLDSIENFLMVGDRLGLDYKRILDECGGREKLETLISHQSDDVYRKSNFIYEEYFEERSIDEGECDWDYE